LAGSACATTIGASPPFGSTTSTAHQSAISGTARRATLRSVAASSREAFSSAPASASSAARRSCWARRSRRRAAQVASTPVTAIAAHRATWSGVAKMPCGMPS
jgi:hypothetical protein